MNKIIKFRAWSLYENKYLDKFSLSQHDDLSFYVTGISSECIVLEQFTGLYDVNEKEIYENDIVIPYFSKNENKYSVVWEESSGRWGFNSLNSFNFIISFNCCGWKVVGNIHQNNE